jgi:hypothetical protein
MTGLGTRPFPQKAGHLPIPIGQCADRAGCICGQHPALIGPTLLEWVGIRPVAENCAGPIDMGRQTIR